jgi:polysaccharide export outer membrane protein
MRRGSAEVSTWLLVGFLVACAAPLPPSPEFEAQPKEGVYVIGAGDRLRIDVWQNDRMGLKDVSVRPDGKITLPLIDDIQAVGLTTDELKAIIADELAEFVQNPDVTVVVLAVLSKRAFVMGEVRNPGPINLASRLRILDAISSAGGCISLFLTRGPSGTLQLVSKSTCKTAGSVYVGRMLRTSQRGATRYAVLHAVQRERQQQSELLQQ